ncbi:bacillithiol system redox-active protein YtxJ [Paenibacillus bovis]|uniref:General stress protein n=1 Tax=Paenibacillus bovis TaxID=1616788 RepID=A0A172ZJ69_9BACL|nr:bacillithiol system redox-active protein YtxJ [Paenibacillus bovis]ANF97638.1 general stress protein [Paenibacillus bovis]
MTNVNQLTTIDQLQEALDHTAERPLLVFKHSTRCPISAGAYSEFQSYLGGSPSEEVDYGLIYVVENRDVSNAAAEKLDLKHESPQAILIKNGEPVWNTSHSRITSSALREALS